MVVTVIKNKEKTTLAGAVIESEHSTATSDHHNLINVVDQSLDSSFVIVQDLGIGRYPADSARVRKNPNCFVETTCSECPAMFYQKRSSHYTTCSKACSELHARLSRFARVQRERSNARTTVSVDVIARNLDQGCNVEGDLKAWIRNQEARVSWSSSWKGSPFPWVCMRTFLPFCKDDSKKWSRWDWKMLANHWKRK